jgi:ABC-type nitrate/sulfonate/bicarbonate transport system permease component
MKKLAAILGKALIIVCFGLLWEIVGRRTGGFLLPPISRVLATYPELLQSGALPQSFLVSMQAFLVGFIASIAVGILVGLLMGRYDSVNTILEPYVNALYSLPRVALVPVVLIWFGVGYPGRVFLIFLGGVFPVLVNTCVGVRNVDKNLTEVGQSFCATDPQLFREIMLPASVPFIMAGIRIGFGRALIGVVVAEFFLEIVGLGGLIIKYGDSFSNDKMLAVILVLSGLGILLTRSLLKLETWLAPWASRKENN